MAPTKHWLGNEVAKQAVLLSPPLPGRLLGCSGDLLRGPKKGIWRLCTGHVGVILG